MAASGSPVQSNGITRLSGGWYMVEPMTEAMAGLLFDHLDAEEIDELKTVDLYDKDKFITQFVNSDRSCAIFACDKLVFGACANWVKLNGHKKRLWDTMSTDYVRKCGLCMSFVKHTPEMIDAFMIGEPTDTVIGVCKSDFARSRKWIERVAKWKEIGVVDLNNHWHTVYEYSAIGKEDGNGR